MKKVLITTALLLLVISVLPFSGVFASPAAQFAGCADEEGLATGVHFKATQLNGVTINVTAVGVDDFDPAITILDEEGNIVICNDTGRDVEGVAFTLPSLDEEQTAGPSESSATASFQVPSDERLTYEIIVSSADGNPGEFVVMFDGASVFPASDEDVYTVTTNEGMSDNAAPLGVYVANLRLPENPLAPRVRVTFGENFELTCSASSSRSLCGGDTVDLTGYTVTLLPDEEPIELIGNDVYTYFELGGDPGEFTVEVSSAASQSTGPYALIIHSGVGIPAVDAEATEEAGG
jgi:hypothetical protein